jgi:hypothetical protein
MKVERNILAAPFLERPQFINITSTNFEKDMKATKKVATSGPGANQGQIVVTAEPIRYTNRDDLLG